ncbi:uncharacterized protein [Halyomorpha halys]|uniref:uncharacterized protein n=1 Tax=Halyomorpha halys TaxID=286706 RepID=UPI0006D515C8|nr:uncharacterized protein LOC106684923 [Halyomorpha halys]
MSFVKRNRSSNFSANELEELTRLIAANPQVEWKQHDKRTETIKKNVWNKIVREFNCNTNHCRRTPEQLKNAWKRIKKGRKNSQMKERQQNSGTTEWSKIKENEILENLAVKVIPDELPTEVISDDEVVDNSEEKEYFSPSNYLHQDQITVEKHEVQSCTERVTSNADEFHQMKMKYLKEEHEKKMAILEEEHAYWRDMRSKI